MIFLTGAAGFIGRHVVCELIAAGAPPRVLLSRPRPEWGEAFPATEVIVGDLLDEDVLRRGLEGARTVVHLASKNVDRDGSGFERTNVLGTEKLCAAAVRAGVERLIYVSSVGVYGHGAHRLADESTPVRPDTPFSRSKAAAERTVLDHHRQGDFTGVVLRHRFVYGEGDEAVVPRLVKAARGYPFWLSGGRARMSLVWAPDFATILRRVAEIDRQALDLEHPVYHVTDGEPIAYRRVITTICRAFGWRPPRFSIPFALLYAPVRLRERLLGIDPEKTAASITSIRLKLVAQDNTFSRRKLERLLGEIDCVSFEEGFRRSLDYYRRFAEG